jgi:PAS domain S-box-containing protein
VTTDLETALFERTRQPTWIFECDTLALLRVNQAVVDRYGYSRDELLAMTLRDLRVPEDIPRLEHTITEFRRGRGWVQRVTRHRTKSGELFDVELEVIGVTYEGKQCALVRVDDLTARTKAELVFKLLVEMSSDGLAIVGDDRTLRYISPGGERILGVRSADIAGTASMMHTHPDDVPKLVYNPPGETMTYVVRVRHGDGSYRWIESTSKNLTNDPAVRGHVVAFRDVTARVHAEEALTRSEANLRVLLEKSPTLTFVHRHGMALYVNRALVDRLGYSDASELVGTSTLDLVHPEDRSKVGERIVLRMDAGGGDPIEVRFVHRDGSLVIVEAIGYRLVFDEQPAIVVFCIDVTERREMYARMAVADRMVSVGTLAAGVAHEINNPLAYVIGNLELLSRELPAVLGGTSRFPAQELHAIVADARDGAVRVAAIVRELRALSRTDESSKGAIDLEPVLVSCLKMVGTEVRHRARVFTSFQPDLPPVEANASRLGQVFLNLLVNAAHAIPEGRGEAAMIRVRAYADAGTVVVEIADTGVGIPPHVIGRIFDPFFTTKPIGQGTGLGLAISHEIVRSLGGSIDVESTPGTGSTFRVVLPAAPRKPAAPERAPAQPVSSTRARVLVIDDEPAVGRSIQALLAPELEVTHVTRGREAIAKITAGERYDAVLCDLMMPEMSGIELFLALQRCQPALARRVVFLTGGAFTDQARDFLAQAEHPPLEKPFTEDQLRAAIERITSSASPA